MSRGGYWDDDEPPLHEPRPRRPLFWDEDDIRRDFYRPQGSGGVTAVGVISIVWGSLVLLLGFCMFFSLLAFASDPRNRAVVLFLPEVGSVITLMILLSIALVLWSVGAIVGGIGTLSRGQWGRIMLLAIGAMGFLLGLFFVWVAFISRRDGGPEPVALMTGLFIAAIFFGHSTLTYVILLNPRVSTEFR